MNPDDSYHAIQERLSAGYERVAEFVRAAADSERKPRHDWQLALEDVAADIDRIVQRDAHPDDVGHARAAMHSLAGVWLTAEEAEALYLGESAP